jgi:hypothetical protein
MIGLEDNLLDLRVVEDVISFYRLAQRHDFIRHEAIWFVSKHVLV